MKIKFDYDPAAKLWQGLLFRLSEKGSLYVSFGPIAFDVYRGLGLSELYFWKFSIQFFHSGYTPTYRKVPFQMEGSNATPPRDKPRANQAEEN